jgi:DNA-directed RNA polymerase subunit beta'
VLGSYYLTRTATRQKGEGKIFASPEEVRVAYDSGEAGLHALIKVRIDGKLIDTTTGRILLREIVPSELPFDLINKVMDKKALRQLVNKCYRLLGIKQTVILSDRLKDLGYYCATKAAISVSVHDMVIPPKKKGILKSAEKEVAGRSYLPMEMESMIMRCSFLSC